MTMVHTNKQLTELSDRLLDLPVENEGMLLSEFDGFVAGLIVCPEMIMPGEWLPVVWGEENAPNFANLDQAQATIDAVMDHYNRVARELAKPKPQYEAILEDDPNSGDLLWEPWICGFERAMRLRPACWEATLTSENEEVQSTIPMILALRAIDEGTSELNEAAIDELDEIAPNLIPNMVVALNAWTKGQSRSQGVANLGMQPTGQRRTGRNDPCPCGSGKKFKKCCGVVTIH